VQDPVQLIKKIMSFLQLEESKYVNNYIQKMVVSNRNMRSSKKNTFSDETKQQILELLKPYY
jgi:hypothetical protein